jgi:mRNA guanylyltransferase
VIRYHQDLVDGRIVEVVYDETHCPPHKWKLLRFRDDKETGNHVTIVERIMHSIRDGVEEDKVRPMLYAHHRDVCVC